MSLPTANLARLLAQTARRLPEAPALRWRDRTWTWAELDGRAGRLAAALRARGVRPGDRVLVHMRNSHAMVESMWACWKAGAAWVPTNVRLTPKEAAWLAQSSGAALMIRDAGFRDHAIACGIPRVLAMPYTAVIRFYDPSVQFMLQWDDPEVIEEPAPAPEPDAPAPAADGPKVVSLDQFRKK